MFAEPRSAMTRPRAILAGICMGMICLIAIIAAAWHYFLADRGPQLFSRQWSISSPDRLDRKTLSNDVWLCPDSPLIEPVGIQRVDWQDTALIGRDPWGYYVYYRARVADDQLAQQLRGMALDRREDLPSWATHRPLCWNPQRSVPPHMLTQIDLQSDDIFIEVTGADVFIYWIRAPFEGHI